ncbi:MAG: LysE/ArgO family amino acid transporter [Rhizobiaceae bacterium]
MTTSNLFFPALEGFALGGSLIIAIGAQNAFILRQGLLREHVFVLCLFAAIADALLIFLGVAGFGALVQSNPTFLYWVTIGGALFLFAYGLIAWRRAWKPDVMKAKSDAPASLKVALATLFAFTFLNPHVYLDTVILLGGISGRHLGDARIVFGAGAMLASFVWFFSLGYGARWLTPIFEKPAAWRILDGIIGSIMFAIAISLLLRAA